MTAAVESFTVHIEDAQIEDLRRRLEATRWPDEPAGNEGWEWGASLPYLHRLVEYWRDGFDWRVQEASLNAFSHYRASITAENGEEHRLHFIHERGSGSHPRAIVLTHGWPSTFLEFVDVVERLAHPERFGGSAEDGLDVVVPSCPGFGFSSKPRTPVGAKATAYLWDRLMRDVLGYPRYIAQGGDFGGFVTAQLGLHYPDSLYGIHLTMFPLVFRMEYEDQLPLTEEESAYLEARRRRSRGGGGYSEIQRTKPMALAYGVTDSPAGLAAWIADKFFSWSDFDHAASSDAFEARVPLDQMLTMLSIYWFTGTIGTANYIYKAGELERSALLGPGQQVRVPTGYADYPPEPDFAGPRVPRSWAERAHSNIVHWAELPRGGHFAALAEPELFADDVLTFAAKLRESEE
jgi:pimeloyl-ACP methyl ester carboxylesterase